MEEEMRQYDIESRAILVAWRKEIVVARRNWLDAIQIIRANDKIWLRRRAHIKVCKGEAAECLKQERACTQLIEVLDGKRPAAGELTGDKNGHLLYRVPAEIGPAFAFVSGLAGLRCPRIAAKAARSSHVERPKDSPS